jgi:hypothetical protein
MEKVKKRVPSRRGGAERQPLSELDVARKIIRSNQCESLSIELHMHEPRLLSERERHRKVALRMPLLLILHPSNPEEWFEG